MRKITILMALVLCMIVCTACAEIFDSGRTVVCVVHKGEWVWVRDAPSPDAEKIETVRFGYELTAYEMQNGYLRVSGWGKDGWVDASYFDFPEAEQTYIVISHGSLNKRETPNGRYLTKIKEGARVSVLGWRYAKDGSLWAKMYRGGYCKAEYLQKAE